MKRGKTNDLHAKSIVLYIRFSDDGKPPSISSSTKAGQRFDNLTHAQKVSAGKFHFRSASSSMLKVPNITRYTREKESDKRILCISKPCGVEVKLSKS